MTKVAGGLTDLASQTRQQVARYGLFGLFGRACLKLYRRVFLNGTLIFVADQPLMLMEPDGPIVITRYTDLAEVDPEKLQQIELEESKKTLEIFRREFADNGILWIATVNGQVVAYQWTRRGRDFRRWYMPLQDEDTVIFNTVTSDNFRGRGIAPYMMSQIIAHQLPTGGRVFIDCKEWNRAAQRSIAKAGFRYLQSARRLSDLHRDGEA